MTSRLLPTDPGVDSRLCGDDCGRRLAVGTRCDGRNPDDITSLNVECNGNLHVLVVQDVGGTRTRVLEAGSGSRWSCCTALGGHLEAYMHNVPVLSQHFR